MKFVRSSFPIATIYVRSRDKSLKSTRISMDFAVVVSSCVVSPSFALYFYTITLSVFKPWSCVTYCDQLLILIVGVVVTNSLRNCSQSRRKPASVIDKRERIANGICKASPHRSYHSAPRSTGKLTRYSAGTRP